MSAADLKQRVAEQSAPKETHDTLALIDRRAPIIAEILPADMDVKRFRNVAWMECQRNPALLDCAPASVLSCLLLAAQYGLEPGPLGHVYLVPFKKDGKQQATFILGYQGMIELARRSGSLRSIFGRVVRDGDRFEYAYGLKGDTLKHTPSGDDAGAPTHYYVVARLAGDAVFHVLTVEQVNKHRARSKAKDSGPWVTDYDAMALKSVVREMRPWLPLGAGFARVIEADESTPEIEGLVDAEV